VLNILTLCSYRSQLICLHASFHIALQYSKMFFWAVLGWRIPTTHITLNRCLPFYSCEYWSELKLWYNLGRSRFICATAFLFLFQWQCKQFWLPTSSGNIFAALQFMGWRWPIVCTWVCCKDFFLFNSGNVLVADFCSVLPADSHYTVCIPHIHFLTYCYWLINK
jgi:hypothetical protein